MEVTDRELRLLGALHARYNTTRSRWTTPKAILADHLIEPGTSEINMHMTARSLKSKGLIDAVTMGGVKCYSLNRAGDELLAELDATIIPDRDSKPKPKTAEQFAADWRTHAAALRKRADSLPGEAILAGTGRVLMAKAAAYEECAAQITEEGAL